VLTDCRMNNGNQSSVSELSGTLFLFLIFYSV